MPYNVWMYVEFESSDGEWYEDNPEPFKVDRATDINGVIQALRQATLSSEYGRELYGRLPDLAIPVEELRAWAAEVEKEDKETQDATQE